jgi:hypothetical protein
MSENQYKNGAHYPAIADGERVIVAYGNGIFTTAYGASIHPDELEWIGSEIAESAWKFPVVDVQEEQIKKMVVDAMEYRWNDWVSDTGTLPHDFELSNSRTKVSFTPNQWADRVAEDIAEYLKSSEDNN